MFYFFGQLVAKICNTYLLIENSAHSLNMNSNFERRIVYTLKAVLTLNFQWVTPNLDTIFELLALRQPEVMKNVCTFTISLS